MVFGRLIQRRKQDGGGRFGRAGKNPMDVSTQSGASNNSGMMMMSSGPSPIKLCVDDLNNAIFPIEDRLISIARAQKMLGGHIHYEQHDEEIIIYGAANALWNKLAMAISCDHSTEEIRRICDILCDIHQYCSKHTIEHTYNEIGYEILPIFVKLFKLPCKDALDPMKQSKKQKQKDLIGDMQTDEESKMTDNSKDVYDNDNDDDDEEQQKEFEKALIKSCANSSDNIKIAVQRCCKVLARYSGIMSEGTARYEIACTNDMLKCLIWIIDINHPLSVEAKCSALAVLCNLAQHTSNHIIMASKEPQLLKKICELALIQTPASVGLISVGPNTVVPASSTTVAMPSSGASISGGSVSTTGGGSSSMMSSSMVAATGYSSHSQTTTMMSNTASTSLTGTTTTTTTTLAGGEILNEGMIIGIREVSSMTLMHLSYGDDYHIPLLDEKSFVVLDTFATLLSMDLRRSSTPQIASKIHETRRYSLIGLYNFACGDENCYKLSYHRKGTLLEVLLTVITQSREDLELRILSMETLYNISCCGDSNPDEEEQGSSVGGEKSTGTLDPTPPENAILVAQALGMHPGLPMALGSLIRFQEAPIQIQTCAVKTLYRLSQLIHYKLDIDHQCFSLLLSALVQASSWTKTYHIAKSFELLSSNKKYHPDHLTIMTRHLGLLNGISAQALLVVPPPPPMNANHHHHQQQQQQQQYGGTNRNNNVSGMFAPDTNSSTAGNSSVAASTNTTTTMEEYQATENTIRLIRRSALSTILMLSTLEANRMRLANNEGIMLSLMKASFDPNYNRNYYTSSLSKEDEEFGKQIKTVHDTLKELVKEL